VIFKFKFQLASKKLLSVSEMFPETLLIILNKVIDRFFSGDRQTISQWMQENLPGDVRVL
jgi:hypothetical protein